MSARTVLVAGATGYLGRYLVAEFRRQGWRVRALARDPAGLALPGPGLSPTVAQLVDEKVAGDVTDPAGLAGVAEGAEAVFSCVSLMGRRSRHSWHEVDHLGNRNLLKEARRAGVRRFGYVSVFNARSLRDVPMVGAHEDFVDDLVASGIDHLVVRPTGFFSDMGAFLSMARSGRVYLPGDGDSRVNPIHGADLAALCVRELEEGGAERSAGGPQTFSQREIAELAFRVLDAEPRISAIPLSVVRAGVSLLGLFRPGRADLLRFFVKSATLDFVAPSTGHRRLEEHFRELARAEGD